MKITPVESSILVSEDFERGNMLLFKSGNTCINVHHVSFEMIAKLRAAFPKSVLHDFPNETVPFKALTITQGKLEITFYTP